MAIKKENDRIKLVETGLNLIGQRLPEMRTPNGEVVLLTYQFHVAVLIPHENRVGAYIGEANHTFNESDAEAMGYMMQCLSQESQSLFTKPGDRELQERVYALFQKFLGRTEVADGQTQSNHDNGGASSKA